MCLGDCTPRRTTIVLDDDVYERLVGKCIKRYGTARALSGVISRISRKEIMREPIGKI